MRRAEATAATRQAVIVAARELLATVPWREFTLEAVATRAGVTRVTVYNQVRNKAGLLDAVLTELTSRAGMDQLLTASRDLGSDEALAFVVEQTCRFWHGERAVLRPLFGLAAVDAGIAEHLAAREDRRREQFRRLLAGRGEAVPPRHGETAPPRQSETAPPRQSETAPPRQSETAPPRQSETAPPRQSETAPPRQSETAPPRQSETAPPRQSETAPPEQGEAVLAGVVAATSFPAYDALGVVGDDPALAAGLVLRMVHGLVSNG
ncbi:TetR family transcriptional regulator [Actinoplanes sp. NPDC048967]|uniref:TetR/AcrR family transcriptional regulator n=1 Tax=Actinoplanes sp. NPDC048967 TaxID=3155269 RepID=UPI0033EF7140